MDQEPKYIENMKEILQESGEDLTFLINFLSSQYLDKIFASQKEDLNFLEVLAKELTIKQKVLVTQFPEMALEPPYTHTKVDYRI